MTTPPRLDRARPRPAHSLPYLAAALLLALGWAWPLKAADPPLGPPLHDGFTFESPIHSGETLRFPVELQQGEFLRVEVDQVQIDVVVRLIDPQGTKIQEADALFTSPTHSEVERLAALAPANGRFLIEIAHSPLKDDKPEGGVIRLRIEGPRAANEKDPILIEALRLTQQAAYVFFQASHEIVSNGSKAAAEFKSAIEQFDQAATLLRRVDERAALAYCLLWSSEARRRSGSNDREAVAKQDEEAAALLEEPGTDDRSAQRVRALDIAGSARLDLSQWAAAKADFERALIFLPTLSDPVATSDIYDGLGRADLELGHPEPAIQHLLEAVRWAQKIEDLDERTTSLRNIFGALTYAYLDAGLFQDALRSVRNGFRPPRDRGSLKSLAKLLGIRWSLYAILGEHRRVVDESASDFEIVHRLGDLGTESTILGNLAASNRFLANYSKAQALYEQAIELARKSQNPEALSGAFTNMAYLQGLDLNQPQKAVEFATQAIKEAGGRARAETLARHVLALALRKQKKSAEARGEIVRALELVRASNDRSPEAEILLTLARIDRDDGRLEAAKKGVEASLRLVESMRPSIFSSSVRASFLAARQAQYEFYVDTLMALDRASPGQHFAERAFEVSERARARTLIEELAHARHALPTAAALEGSARLHDLSRKIGNLQVQKELLARRGASNPKEIREILKAIDEAVDEADEIEGTENEASAKGTAQDLATPLALPEIQKQVLGPGALLLEYQLGTERSHLWVVTSDSIQAFELPSRAVIEGSARRYYDLLTARNRHPQKAETVKQRDARWAKADSDLVTAGRELSKLLLEPVAPHLQDRTLLVVADGALSYVPFGALPDPGGADLLLAHHAWVQLPSASTLGALRRDRQSRLPAAKAVAVIGAPKYRKDQAPPSQQPESTSRGEDEPADSAGESSAERPAAAGELSLPPLPWAEKESRSIAALVPKEDVLIALGSQASRQTIDTTDLSQYRYLHFATHGLVDAERPQLSALVLSLYDNGGQPVDGYLRLVDIDSLRLNADLVTLSACRTALGQEVRGEGLIGLTRGFLTAGARRVVASLWSVEDGPTAKLMASFYRFLLSEHLTPAESLRKAQLEMSRDPKKSSPYYWAAFTLQGEWQ
jgi:CHAT domain-containing protein